MAHADQPLVSVGMTTYNQPEKLEKALDCVVNQTYRNLEILVSEDCSPCARTRDLLDRYAAADSRIRVIHQEKNLGPPTNINFVLTQAKGEFFMWADDDDLRDERWVEVLLKKLLSDASAITALGRVVAIDDDGNTVQYCEPLGFEGSRVRRLADYFLADEGGGKACIVCGIYRTDFLQSIKPWGEYDRGFFGVDFLFAMDCLQHGNVLADQSVTIYKRRSAPDKPHLASANRGRFWKRMQYYLNCARVPARSLDGLVLLTLIPVKMVKSGLAVLARRVASRRARQ